MTRPRRVGPDDVALACAARLAALTDAPLDLLADGDEPRRDDDAWRAWIAAHVALFVATHDGEPVAIGGLEPDRDGRDVVWLAGLWVTSTLRGTGLADALLAALLDAAGPRAVSLDVVATNARARAFYARHGFVAVSLAPRTDGVVEVTMTRDTPRRATDPPGTIGP